MSVGNNAKDMSPMFLFLVSKEEAPSLTLLKNCLYDRIQDLLVSDFAYEITIKCTKCNKELVNGIVTGPDIIYKDMPKCDHK